MQPSAAQFVVWVEFEIAPDSLDAFVGWVLENSRTSLEQEPGCLRFDVLFDPDAGPHVALYEIYSDAEAFAEHLRSAHFMTFDAWVRPMVRGKRVKTYHLRKVT